MNFELTEEQSEIQALARKILEDYCSNEQLREFDSAERFNADLWQQLAETGLLGLGIGEQYGGMGFDFETLCLLLEEVGRAVAPIPVLPALVLAGLSIQNYGSDAVKQAILPGIASGDVFVTAALFEAVNYTLQPSRLQAKQDGDSWRLNGDKQFVPFAECADYILSSASIDGEPALFLLERKAAGLSFDVHTSTAGENQCSVSFSDVKVDAERCLVQGEAAVAALNVLENAATAAACAQMLGVCDAMLRLTASYTSEREQFGVKIATFQAVGQRAADCYIDVECLRLVTQRAVYAVDHCDEAEATEACLIAKIWAGDAGHRVSHAAQHLHGGMGVDRDYSLWRYCLWAKQLELFLGGSAELTEKLGENIAASFIAAA